MTSPELVFGWPRGTVRSVIDGLSGPSPLAIDLHEWKSIHHAIEDRFDGIRPWFDGDLRELLIRAVSPILPLATDAQEIDQVLSDCAAFLGDHGSISAVIAAARRRGDYEDRLQAERDRMPGYITRRGFEIAGEMAKQCRDCTTSTPLAEGTMHMSLVGTFVTIEHYVGLDRDPIRYMVPFRDELDGRADERTPVEPLMA